MRGLVVLAALLLFGCAAHAPRPADGSTAAVEPGVDDVAPGGIAGVARVGPADA